MSHATPAQLAYAMGLLAGFATAQLPRALQLLEDATDTIDKEIEQPLLSSEDTVTLDGTGTKKLLLPRHPVTAVAEVVEIDSDGVETVLVYRDDYTWSESGILTRVGRCWPCHDQAVRSVYTAGLATIPATVRRICCRLAASAWDNPYGLDAEDVGDRRAKWAAPGGELTTGEKRQLDPFRKNT